MRILIIAMCESIHTARWISQINHLDWEIYLYPVYRARPHHLLKNITIFGTDLFPPKNFSKSNKYIKWTFLNYYIEVFNRLFRHKQNTTHIENNLHRVIRKIKPDIIHSLEFQHASAITLNVKKKFGRNFPKWIATNWGSDIYLFRKIPQLENQIKDILKNCDYYSCECRRDVELAKMYGFKGTILPVLPNAGGVHLDKARNFRQPGTVSQRKLIVIKGYQHWAGRALVAIQALRYCLDELRGYSIAIFSSNYDVEIASHIFKYDTGIEISIVSNSNHDDILKLLGKARIYVGLSISDGISTSFLDALVMGAFPIQSCTSCADEWILNGTSGFIVPPEDPHKIAEAIKISLTNDKLVDKGVEINDTTIRQKLDYKNIQNQVINIYKTIYNEKN